MKLIYLHDPKVGASVLTQLEETFPMLEIVAIDLDDDFDKQFEELKKLFGQFTFSNPDSYAIVADGVGVAYASFFTGIRVKGQTLSTITILLNPDYRALKNDSTLKKLPKDDYSKKDCLHTLTGCKAIYSFNNYNLLAYHQQYYGGDYLLLSLTELFPAIKDLIFKSAIGPVNINYLKVPVLTPGGQILPPDRPIVSVEGSFDWFGEKLFNARIPNSAFKYRDKSCFGPSRLYLLKGDVISNDLEEASRSYKYLGNYIFLDIDTGERIEGHRAPFALRGFPGILPDWNTVWSIREYVMYQICITFKALKKPSKGYDKYGNEFKVMAIGYDAIHLWRENEKNRLDVRTDCRCQKEEYVAGVFPKSATPELIHLMPYSYEGIMVFKSTSKVKSKLALKVIFNRNSNRLTQGEDQDNNE